MLNTFFEVNKMILFEKVSLLFSFISEDIDLNVSNVVYCKNPQLIGEIF